MDWSICGRLHASGVLRTVYGFVMTLSYSRMMYVEFTFRCDTRAFIRAHMNAFAFFGGVPKTCLYDNVKSVRLAGGEDGVRLNPTFADFADLFGFHLSLCRPYRAQTKGKVESGIAYVKGNFLAGETFSDLAEMNRSVASWLSEVANVRTHGTTGEVPAVRFTSEGLRPLRPGIFFDTYLYEKRKITSDCLVSYQGCRYSVPHAYAGREATIRDYESGAFEVLVDGEVVEVHELSPFRGKTIISERHYRGIPVGDAPPRKRLPILTRFELPEVEERPLSVYETLAGELS